MDSRAFSNPMPEMHQLACLARRLDGELNHAAEVLIVGVLSPLLHNTLIRDISEMLQKQQPDHQTYRLGRSAVVFAKQPLKGLIEYLPLYLIGKFEQWMCLVERIKLALAGQSVSSLSRSAR